MEKDFTTPIIPKIQPQRKHAGTSRNTREKIEETVISAKNVLAHAASAKESLYELKRKEIEEYVGNLRHKGHHSLASEVEQSFRKISDCLEEFEDSLSRHKTAFTSNQREKLEMDFKREMKRIQRQRDQIKQWLNDTSIKDKSMLEEMKLIIETQMERYKQIERDCKAREYSDYSLNISKPLTPLEQEEQKTCCWLDKSIGELQSQVDKMELEIGKILDTKKRKFDWQQQKAMDEYKGFIKKHTSHIGKLEIIKRILTNLASDSDELSSFLHKVAGITEDIDYYIQSGKEPEYEENDHLYDEIDEVERACFNGNLSLKAVAPPPVPTQEKESNAASPPKTQETQDQKNTNNKDASPPVTTKTGPGQPQPTSKQPTLLTPNTNEKKPILTVAIIPNPPPKEDCSSKSTSPQLISQPPQPKPALKPSISSRLQLQHMTNAKEKDSAVTEVVSEWKNKDLIYQMSAWPQLRPSSQPAPKMALQNLTNTQEKKEPVATMSVPAPSWKDKVCSAMMSTQPRPMMRPQPQVQNAVSVPNPPTSVSLHQLTDMRQKDPDPVVTSTASPWTVRDSYFNIPAPAWPRLRPQLQPTDPVPRPLTSSSAGLNYLANVKENEPVPKTVAPWKDKESFFSISALSASSRIGRPQSTDPTSKPPTLSSLNYLNKKEKEPVVTRTPAPWKGKESFFSAPTSPRLLMTPLTRPPPTAPRLHYLTREREQQLTKGTVPPRQDRRFFPNGSTLPLKPQLSQTTEKPYIPGLLYLPVTKEEAGTRRAVPRVPSSSKDRKFSDRATSPLKPQQTPMSGTPSRVNCMTLTSTEMNDPVRRKAPRSKEKEREPCFSIPTRSRPMRPLTRTEKPAASVKRRREKAARYVERFRPRQNSAKMSILFFAPAFPPLLEALEAAVLISTKSVEKPEEQPEDYTDAFFNIPGLDGPPKKMTEIIEEELFNYGPRLSKSFGSVDSLDSDSEEYTDSRYSTYSWSNWSSYSSYQ